MDRIIRKNRKFEFVLSDVRRFELRTADDGDVELARFDSSGVYVDSPLRVDMSTGAVTLSGALTVGGELTTDENDISYRTVASDVVPTIGRDDGVIELLASASGAKVILTDTSGDNAVDLGQEVVFFLAARSGGSYTLALSTGTLTFDAALETARVVRTSLGWNVVALNGATIV